MIEANSPVTAADRLGLMLFLAASLHAILILGVTFGMPERDGLRDHPTMDITLVKTRSAETPEEADYLAQANQDGSGNTQERVRAQSPDTTSADPRAPEVVPRLEPVPPAPPVAQPMETVLTEADTEVEAPPPVPEEPQLSAEQLISRSMEIASLNQALNESILAYSQRPRQKRISARTREYKYATYMDNWVRKVERIGNLNYPDEARRQKLFGALLLDVAVRADGSLHSITLLRSSGSKVLDDAAVRIVRLSAPFAPFPEDIRADTDVLHIIRTWEFLSSNRLFSK